MLTREYIEGIVSRRILFEQEKIQEIRLEKVIDTRRKLRSGKYNIEDHLNIAIDRLLEEILVGNQKNQPDIKKSN